MSETPENKQPKKAPGKGAPVFTYLAIMFAAAFLMLLLAYFIQQRNNEVAIDGLKDSLTSFQSMDELMEENRALREELEALEQEKETLEETVDAWEAEYAQLEEMYQNELARCSATSDYLASWGNYWEIEQFYRSERYEECAEAIKTLRYSTYYSTPDAAQERANEIWDALEGMGLLTEEDDFANTFRYVPPQE